MFVALGFAVTEVVVFFGIVPLAVGGIVLFGGSWAGLLHEVGYGSSSAQVLTGVGGLLVVLGVGVWVASVSPVSVQALRAAPASDGIALRGPRWWLQVSRSSPLAT